MRFHFCWFLLSLCTANVASAQGLFVQTGEHTDFTRVVIRIPETAAWTATQSDREVRVVLDNHSSGFDTRSAFDLIPRDRINAFSSTDNRLSISLNCSCRASVFIDQNRYLVLDVADAEQALAGTPVSLTQTIPDPSTKEDPVTPQPLPDQVTAFPSLFSPTRRVRREMPHEFELNRSKLDDVQSAALRAMQERLAREVGSAATRGILTPQPGAAIAPAPELAKRDVVPTPENAASSSVSELPGLSNNMRISSSMDMPEASDAGKVSLSGAICPDDADVDISQWSNGQPLYDQLGPLRAALFDERDTLQPEKVATLARLFLHFGFGVEARDILTLDNPLSTENRLLLAIADIMENGYADPALSLRPMTDCASDVSLWALLSKEKLTYEGTIDPTAALLALNKLPAHLRRFIAPELSKRFLDYGDQDAADAALRSVERLPETAPSSVQLAQARLALDRGDVDKGTAQLKAIKNESAPEAVEALITLVDTQLASNQPIDPDTAGLVAAYAKEYRGAELGPALRRAHVLALVKSGQFDKAFKEARQLGADLEDDAAIELRLQLLAELTANAGDIVFLDQIFVQNDRDIARLPQAEKIRLASRLLAMGFAIQAQQTLLTLPDRPINTERQLLAAQIALALNQPMRAFAALIEVEGDAAKAMRAQAKSMAGDHDDAYALFVQTGQAQNAARAAWLADNLASEPLSNDPVFGPIVGLSDVDLNADQNRDGMLGRTDAMLQESRSARAALSEFLATSELEF